MVRNSGCVGVTETFERTLRTRKQNKVPPLELIADSNSIAPKSRRQGRMVGCLVHLSKLSCAARCGIAMDHQHEFLTLHAPSTTWKKLFAEVCDEFQTWPFASDLLCKKVDICKQKSTGLSIKILLFFVDIHQSLFSILVLSGTVTPLEAPTIRPFQCWAWPVMAKRSSSPAAGVARKLRKRFPMWSRQEGHGALHAEDGGGRSSGLGGCNLTGCLQ